MALKIDHLTVLVSSLETSMPYYDCLLDALGYRKLRPHVFADGSGFFFQFLQAHEGTSPYERYGAGMNHLGFAAPDEAFVHRLRQTMYEAGFPVPEIQNLRGAVALFMKDPDGIRFEITWYPPGMQVVD